MKRRGEDDHGVYPPPRLYANGAVERAAAAYRQAQVDVHGWATLELRIRYRALKRQAVDSTLDDVGHACLRAVTDELWARGEQTPL